MLEPDAVLQGRYRLVRKLGGGGMGQVYLAHDTRLADKPCAVKELIPDRLATPEEQAQAAEQFRREAGILARLSHPNLPNVYDYFEENGNFYLVMDFIEGENLADRLARSPGGLPQEMVVEWAVQLCDVLDYLHTQTPPVIFRDMKPSNVMITPQGTVKLVDFGVARLFDPTKRTDTLKMGTAGYAPPEQYAGQGQTTPRSDIYALGATLHELLTGVNPTAQPFVFAPPQTVRPGVSAALSDVVMKAVSLAPDDRYATTGELKTAMQQATRPRRTFPALIQRRATDKTRLMTSPAGAPATRPLSHNRAARLALGALRWTVRVALTVALVLVIAAVVLLIGGALILSRVVERAISSVDWGLTTDADLHFRMSEKEFEARIQDVIELYALDAAQDVRVDLNWPDEVRLSLRLFDTPLSLEARVEKRQGAPAVILERLNNAPLYIVGGIVSAGINRGFQQAWEGSPLEVTRVAVERDTLIVDLEP